MLRRPIDNFLRWTARRRSDYSLWGSAFRKCPICKLGPTNSIGYTRLFNKQGQLGSYIHTIIDRSGQVSVDCLAQIEVGELDRRGYVAYHRESGSPTIEEQRKRMKESIRRYYREFYKNE